jgi:hypothetical protein
VWRVWCDVVCIGKKLPETLRCGKLGASEVMCHVDPRYSSICSVLCSKHVLRKGLRVWYDGQGNERRLWAQDGGSFGDARARVRDVVRVMCEVLIEQHSDKPCTHRLTKMLTQGTTCLCW